MKKETKESQSCCVFCKILSGAIPSSEVYRDKDVAAFMDIQPVNPGHVLVIPIKHSPYLENLDPEIGAKMFKVAQKVTAAVRKSGVKCEGVNIFVADGEAAMQEVFHTHIHVFPRYEGDGFGLRFSATYMLKPERAELDKLAVAIKSKMI